MRLRTAGMMLVFAGLLAACHAPRSEPRSYFDFMEDGIAREGVLARCNRDRDATLNDLECSNARRAAAALAIEQEHNRSDALAQESQRKLAALRNRADREQRAELEEQAVARKEAELAYERRWPNPDGQQAPAEPATATESAPAFGAPLGRVLPSISGDAPPLEVSDVGAPPSRPSFGAVVAEPPSNEIEILKPQVQPEDVKVVPQHLRAAAE
jgi:hypothetical protein